MSPVNSQHHEIRNYFLKPFHLLGGDRKLKHQLSIKSLQTIKKKKKQPKESKGFETEHGSLIKEGSVSNLMTPQDIWNGHLKKKNLSYKHKWKCGKGGSNCWTWG